MRANETTNILTIRVPRTLKERIEATAHSQGVSINQFALYAFTKELGELETSDYYKAFLASKDREDILNAFDRFMDSIPSREVPDWDKIPD